MGICQSTTRRSRKRSDSQDDEDARGVMTEEGRLLPVGMSDEEYSDYEEETEEEADDRCWGLCSMFSGGSQASRMLIADNAGSEPKSKYDIQQDPIGHGGYGTVRKCKSLKGGPDLAMKTMAKSAIPSSVTFQEEINIQLLLDHPNIVRLFEVFEDRQNVYLIMELCQGGEMFDLIIENERFGESDAAFLMRQMLQSIYYMHSKRVAHRDLKPENFLLSAKGAPIQQNPLKLIDFGLSKTFAKGASFRTKIGTPTYAAPEIMLGAYNEKVDVWSLGVIMYVLLCGYPPFDGQSVQDIIRAARKRPLKFDGEEWVNVSQTAKDFISQMCAKDPKTRLSSKDAAQHPWLQVNPTHLALVDQAQSAALLRNLRAFSGVSRFKRAALHMVAHRLDSRVLANLQEIWRSLDVNSDGTLTLRELKEGLARAGVTSELTGSDADKYFRNVDTDHSGHIDYTEFLASMLSEVNFLQEDACWEAFRVFDRDGSGTISTDELAEVLDHQGLKEKTNQDSLQKIFAEVDANGDGEIDFDEFMEMLRSHEGAGGH